MRGVLRTSSGSRNSVRASLLKAALRAGGVGSPIVAIVATHAVLLPDVDVPPVYRGSPSYAIAPPTSRPVPSPTPPNTRCVGTVGEYCVGGKCPTYAESIESLKKHECKLRRNNLRIVV